jgi:polar amino acid transport system substrate-binding protein
MVPGLRSLLLAVLAFACGCAGAQEPRFVTEGWPPFNYREGGVARGIAIDLVAEAQRRMGTSVPVEFLPWERAYRMATAQPGVLIFTLARRAEREALFNWVFPIHPRAVHFYKHRSRADVRAATVADARRYVVGTAGENDSGTLDLLAAGFEIGRNLVIVREGDVSKAKMPLTARAAGLDPAEFERQALLSSQGEYYFAYSRGTPTDRIERLRKVFRGMVDDGTFAAIKRRYLN